MIRPLTCIFLVLAFLALTHGSQISSSLNLRNLASTDSSSIKTYDLVKYGKNYAINVDLGDEYLARTNMTHKNETAMVVLLYDSATAFCSTCLETVEYDCTNNSCQADTTVEQTFVSLHYVFSKANPINQTVIIGNSKSAPWSLATNASLHSFSFTRHDSIFTASSQEHYISNKSTYGILGLGVDKGAAANFKGDHPLFSLSMNSSSGDGRLIFGKNSSLYDASTTPTVLPTDANWTMMTQNFTFGPNYINTNFTSDIIFDLQYPGIGIPYTYFGDHWPTTDFLKNLEKSYGVVRKDSLGIENFPYIFQGNLSSLPNMTITMTNNQTITIPPSAYTRKSPKANDTYSLLIDRTGLIQEKVYALAPGRTCTVLGWPVLAHFYTIFEQKNGSQTITLYPAITPRASSESLLNSFSGARIIQVIAVLGILIVVYMCFKRRAAAKLESELGEELRTNNRPQKNGGEYHKLLN